MRSLLAVLLIATAGAWSFLAQEPPPAADALRFAVIGDNGTGDRFEYEVAQQMVASRQHFPFELVLMLGDNIYGGQSPRDFVQKFEAPYRPLLEAGVRFYASLGNHDNQSNRLYQPFNMDGERYYTFARRNVRFFVLDSDYLDAKQLAWVDGALRAPATSGRSATSITRSIRTGGATARRSISRAARADLHQARRQRRVFRPRPRLRRAHAAARRSVLRPAPPAGAQGRSAPIRHDRRRLRSGSELNARPDRGVRAVVSSHFTHRDRRRLGRASQGAAAMTRATRAFRFATDHYLIVPLGALAAIVWANSRPESYFAFAHAWSFAINDVAMVFFFALITAEIIEATVPGGALHTWRRIALPVAGAAGCIAGAAIAYHAYLSSGDELSVLGRGWPVPGAFDLAFGYVVARNIWRRHPAIPFLLLIGIASDALGIGIVELRGPADRHVTGLLFLAAAVAIAFALRRRRVTSIWPYVLGCGPCSWWGLFTSGLHPALALVPIVPFFTHAARDRPLFAAASPQASDALSRFDRAWRVSGAGGAVRLRARRAGCCAASAPPGGGDCRAGQQAARDAGRDRRRDRIRAATPRRVGWRELVVIAFTSSIGFILRAVLRDRRHCAGPGSGRAEARALLTVSGAVLATTPRRCSASDASRGSRRPDERAACRAGGPFSRGHAPAAPPRRRRSPTGRATPSSSARSDHREAGDLKDNRSMSLQGRTSAIRGSVECVEDLLIEGRIEGHIWNESHVVTVGADALVTGDIVARQITVRGAVEGTLMATGRVDIMNEARVAGRVLSKSLMLADGAVFNGKAEPQHLDAALKVARHRRTEAAAGAAAKASA
jgi:NhaA family Na+:H+ antiporter